MADTFESMCHDCGVNAAEVSEMKRHGFTDGLATQCAEVGLTGKNLRNLFFQFGPKSALVPILMEIGHMVCKAKRDTPTKPKPEKDDEKPAPEKKPAEKK